MNKENPTPKTRVAVYQGENLPEVQLIKSKLEDAGLECSIENAYMSFLGTPTSTSLSVKVALEDEAKALEIIDSHLQSQDS